ncbi:two-component response regulator ARR12-like [Lotus japonicus]|uniref:two-component response regulator ARR12-like n=1 Tax=Lotus japonicus TaxID=34305 RepID=UPI00258D5B90|nr:two-component response regulator ARR12-like [Lotus japonicus]
MDVTVRNPLVGDYVAGDHFPVGMRILAVDGDQACLRVLENLLRKCNYNVTTTTHSIMALEILRRNRNNFDLVITAVNKPDMDGFYLLKKLGLEMMDIPVIMLSGHNDKELVMSCVVYGACDYLLKPIRMEEMKNIWQHVVRKKMIGSDQNQAANKDKTCNVAGEGSSYGCTVSENRMSQKRKELSEDEKLKEDDEQSSRKKARLVWTTDLHSKFVAAVQQLGFDRAVPKKILKLMNVEGLSKQHVASHLQKFKLSLKNSPNPASLNMGGSSGSYPFVQPIQSANKTSNATHLSSFSENLSPLSEVNDDQLVDKSLKFCSSGSGEFSATSGVADPVQNARADEMQRQQSFWESLLNNTI